ncbi:MAG: alkaline phosphatase family protein [Candidatus Helarchaeota archaeon]
MNNVKNSKRLTFLLIASLIIISGFIPYISSLLPKQPQSTGVKRVILISIDSCNPEYISPMFMPNLYSRILRDGIKFKVANTILGAETQSGHTSMLTGSFPTHSGIIGNGLYFPEDWVDPETNETVYHAGTKVFTITDHRLVLTNTIFEQFKDNSSIKTAFVSGKWRLVPLLSEGANLIFGNNKVEKTYMIPPDYYQWVGAPLCYSEGDAIDVWTINCLIETIKHNPEINFTFVNLAYLDDLQHAYGGYNEMIYHQLRELDNMLLRLFNELEARGEYDSTLFVVTGDHGSDRTDYYINLYEVFGQSSNPHIDAEVHAEGQSAYIFLDNASQLQEAITLLESQEGIGLIVPRDNSSVVGYQNYSAYNIYPYYNRSGDIFVCAKEHGAIITNPNVPFTLFGMHGGISTRDVPMAFFCKNLQFKDELRGFEINNYIPNTVDILTTIASIMNWTLNNMTLDGEILNILK